MRPDDPGPDNAAICSWLAQHFLGQLLPRGWRMLDFDGHLFLRVRDHGGALDGCYEVRFRTAAGARVAVTLERKFMEAAVWRDAPAFVRALVDMATNQAGETP